MISQADLYLTDLRELHSALYRVQFPPFPLFPEERLQTDVATYVKNGVVWVCANGNGASLFDHAKSWMIRPGRVVYRFSKNTPIPFGLVLVKDARKGYEGHYMLAPQFDMPASEYLGLLEKMISNPSMCRMLNPKEIENALIGNS